LNALLLKARQPVIDDFATTYDLSDFAGSTRFAFPGNDLATLAKGMGFAFAIAVFQRRALSSCQFYGSCFTHLEN
jgi:hypothetical protein